MINSLNDLKNFRSAPILDKEQEKKFFQEFSNFLETADWFTIGIMANSSSLAVLVLREMEIRLNWQPMEIRVKPNQEGPVFLKANQRTGDVHIRIENGLGEGILIGCHHDSEGRDVEIVGPLPLNFFRIKE